MDSASDNKVKFHFQRFEFKYQLPLSVVEGMIPEFLKYMDIDPYCRDLKDQAYNVNSLYYDSAGLDCYYQKIAGLRTRKKLRVRFYNGDFKPETPVFLEIKRKYDTVVVKDRLVLNYQQAKDLLVGSKMNDLDLTEAEKNTLNEFLWLKEYNGMTPTVMVCYKRKPFISKLDPNFRVTIDFGLKTYSADWLDSRGEERFVSPDTAVLEVKFNNILPAWFHQIIERYGFDQRPFSKYCNSLEINFPWLADRSHLEVYQSKMAV